MSEDGLLSQISAAVGRVRSCTWADRC